jgi:hypothetical protein
MKITFGNYVEKQNVRIGKVVKAHKIAHAVFTHFSCHLRSIKIQMQRHRGALHSAILPQPRATNSWTLYVVKQVRRERRYPGLARSSG